MSVTPFLSLRSVRKRFGKTEALAGIDLEVMPDELLVVLGPTGAGKTTLLRTIAGLENPEEGTLSMAGQDITAAPPAQRDVALVFQNFSLYPDWTVRQNLEFPLKAPGRNHSPAQISERVEWAAALLKISRLLDRKSTQLSGGEMQRVAIGRAIVRRPRIFLMDEPLTNLDAKLREALRVELIALRRQLHTPMVFVTHDQAEALSMGDRIVVLSAGRILQTGLPREVYRNPASPLVAKQLGQPAINLMEVTRREGQWTTATGIAIAPAADDAPQRMTLGIRPEDIAPTGGTHEGKIAVVEDMGPTLVLLVRFAGGDLHIVTDKSHPFEPGEVIRPHFDRQRILLWPLAT